MQSAFTWSSVLMFSVTKIFVSAGLAGPIVPLLEEEQISVCAQFSSPARRDG